MVEWYSGGAAPPWRCVGADRRRRRLAPLRHLGPHPAMHRTVTLLGPLLALALLALAPGTLRAEDEAALALSPGGHHDVELTRPDSAIWQLRTTANDPYV